MSSDAAKFHVCPCLCLMPLLQKTCVCESECGLSLQIFIIPTVLDLSSALCYRLAIEMSHNFRLESVQCEGNNVFLILGCVSLLILKESLFSALRDVEFLHSSQSFSYVLLLFIIYNDNLLSVFPLLLFSFTSPLFHSPITSLSLLLCPLLRLSSSSGSPGAQSICVWFSKRHLFDTALPAFGSGENAAADNAEHCQAGVCACR